MDFSAVLPEVVRRGADNGENDYVIAELRAVVDPVKIWDARFCELGAVI